MLNLNEKADFLPEDEKKRAAYALNMCTVSVSQIIDYNDINILEQEYEAILNNLNLETIIKDRDNALLHVLKQILDTITFFRIAEGDRAIIEEEYQQKMKNAIWSAVPNFGLLIAGGNPLTMAISLASQVGIGYMNYRRNKAELELNHKKELWELQKNAIEQFNGLRRELFDTAWRLASEYQFPDEYRLTERQIKQYNNILMDTDLLRKYERLDTIKDEFEAYPPFWYFIGNAANAIAGDPSLHEETRREFRQKALEYFEKYESFEKYSILREDQLMSSCILEHIDILLLGNNYDRNKIIFLLKQAVKFSGKANDVLQLSAITYLKMGEQTEASKLLKQLVNESYNKVVNAQFLSGIYVHTAKRSEYELLAKKINKEYLFPYPQNDGQDMKTLESRFYRYQKGIIKKKYEKALSEYCTAYSVQWNKITSTFDSQRNYADSFFYDTEQAKRERLSAAEILFSSTKKSDQYKTELASAEYTSQLLDILNQFYKGLSSLPCLSNSDSLRMAQKSIESYLISKRDDVDYLQQCISSQNFGLEEYKKSQQITISAIVKKAVDEVQSHIDGILEQSDIENTSALDNELYIFCIKQGIKEPDITVYPNNDNAYFDERSAETFTTESSSRNKESEMINNRNSNEASAEQPENVFDPKIFGQDAVLSGKYEKFKTELENYVKEKMTEIPPLDDKTVIYYRSDPAFNGYFSDEAFHSHPDIKNYAIMVLHNAEFKGTDLIFTAEGIVGLSNRKIKFKTNYDEVELKNNSIILYRQEYKTTSFDIHALYNLIRELGDKFRKASLYTEEIGEKVTVKMLNQWFLSQPNVNDPDIWKVYALPDKDILKQFNIRLDASTGSNCILQFLYNKKTNTANSLRIVKYHSIDTNFQALLKENQKIIIP